MPRIYNGNCRVSINVDNKSDFIEIQGNNYESDDNISSSEADFRGFEKVPLVLCQRLDISPYLNKTEYQYTPDMKAKMISNENQAELSINKLLLPCSVLLVREDLEKLKEILKNSTQGNNNGLKCKICDKPYISVKKLQNHKEKKHMIFYKTNKKVPKRVSFSDQIIVHEVKEYHRCRKCPRIFEEYNSLRLHMKQKHRKRRCYICHYCSKDFVDRSIFKIHIKLHCDSCGMLLANKKKYLEHRRYVCHIKNKYECKTCHMFVFNYMDLKDHSYDHLGTFFKCDICKEHFQTKCEVSHHITFLHMETHSNQLYIKRQDGIYKCNYCDKMTSQQRSIEEHVSKLPDLQNRVMTSYKDYFFCKKCLRKFSSEKDLLQHKWCHSLKTSDNSQLRNGEAETNDVKQKTTYRLNEELPDYFQPKLLLEKIQLPNECQESGKEDTPAHITNNFNNRFTLKKAVVDPVTKKTIISKYKCEECGKYLSSNYCLNRHLHRVHGVDKKTNCVNNLQCKVCEEEFEWPLLLQNHNCIRMALPEMPFDDNRPEIQFDNHIYIGNGLDTCNASDDEEYMNEVDFEITAPIVQLTEFEDFNIVVNGGNGSLDVINNKTYSTDDLNYKFINQEVPIEF